MGRKHRSSETSAKPPDPETSQPPSQPPHQEDALEITLPDVSSGADKWYSTRRIYFKGSDVRMICQNQNGPYALLSLCNGLLLRGEMHLGLNKDGQVSESELMTSLLTCLQSSYEDLVVRRYFTLEALLRTILKLGKDFAVDVNFAGPRQFGYTGKAFGQQIEVALFKTFGVDLCHGWIIDPEDEELINYVAGKSYDKLENEFQLYNSILDSGKVMGVATTTKWTRIGQLLNGRSLTEHGLLLLQEDIQEEEICVLFWDNHFHTVVKDNGQIYLLQTDEGYLSSDVVWKQLAGVNHEGDHLTCFFTPSGQTVSEDGTLYFMNFLLEPSVLIAHLPPSSIHTIYKMAGKIIVCCTHTMRELFLKRLSSQMSKDEINTFYQSVYEMIKDETDKIGVEYLSSLMGIHNQEFALLAKEGIQNSNLEKVIAILQMNRQAAEIVGQKFREQIQVIFQDMMLIYSNCTQQICTAISEQKPVEHLRCVNREVLTLMNTFFEAQDSQNYLVMALMENQLFTYGNSGFETREHELLLFETIVKKGKEKMNDTVLTKLTEILNDLSTSAIEILKYHEHCLQFLSLLDAISCECFQVFTKDSCKRLNLIMDFIIGALCQTEKDIDLNAVHLLSRILQNIKASELTNDFYKAYFFKIGQTIIKVLMGMNYTNHSEFFLLLLQQLFNGIGDLTEHTWDAPLECPQYNTMIIRDNVTKFMNTTFPDITVSKAGSFVDGLLNSTNDLPSLLNCIRESLVLSSGQVDQGEASTQAFLVDWLGLLVPGNHFL